MRKAKFILLLALGLTLCACRTRVIERESPPVQTAQEPPVQEAAAPVRIDAATAPPEEPPQELPEEPPEQPEEPATEPDAPAEQDETSERREFAENASGELTPDAETPLYAETEQPADATAADGGEAAGGANTEAVGAELSATETVRADEAEQLGVDESGEVAESVQTYYLTLLDSRLGSLFECKRLYVYWETDEDHRTVFKTSDEHQIIIGAGAYDVSAKLLEENLTVDDGWVFRKNPDAVVKAMDGGPLDPLAAQTLCDELAVRPEWANIGAIREGRTLVLSRQLLETSAGRTAAMVYLAKLLYPEQMEDVDADEALRALTQEASGSAYAGQYAYSK
ncbi:MAG: hypothetical protein E7474_10395 [Ruminococcaceae bacterium]|nr:hypothetical protein [Oscillospiraceae bacterium]